MSFKEFWKLAREKYWIVIICIIVIILAVAWFNSKVTNTYEGNIGFSIVRLGASRANEFSDYYATEADNLVTGNFTKWLKSKPFTAQVYEGAGIDLDKENLDQIIKKIDVAKLSGTDIAYQYEVFEKERAQKIGAVVIEGVNNRTAQIKKSAQKDVNARGLQVSSKLSIHQKSTNQRLNYLLGFLGGVLLGLVILLIVRYFSSPKKR